MDWKINLLLLLMIIYIYYYTQVNRTNLYDKETFINNNTSINNNIENTYGLDKRCDLENPEKVIPNELLVKSNKKETSHHKKILKLYKNKCSNPCMNICFYNCMNKYIDLDREILKVPLYIYPELYYHPLDEPN